MKPSNSRVPVGRTPLFQRNKAFKINSSRRPSWLTPCSRGENARSPVSCSLATPCDPGGIGNSKLPEKGLLSGTEIEFVTTVPASSFKIQPSRIA